jgi:hypothetical protein
MDNLSRALKRGGRILLECIPKKYDTARQIRIIGEDQKQRIITVNAPFVDQNGKTYHHRLDAGKYDAQVEQGPSESTARAETREMIMTLAQGNQQVWQLAADIFFENQDFIGADRLAKRFRRALPQALQDDDEGGKVGEDQLKAQLAQLQQASQLLQQQNQELVELLKTKVLDLASRERIATQGNETRMFVAEAQSRNAAVNKLAEIDHQALQAELDRRAQLLNTQISVQADQFADERERQAEMQQQQLDQQHQQQMQQLQHQQQLEQQQQAQQNQGPGAGGQGPGQVAA